MSGDLVPRGSHEQAADNLARLLRETAGRLAAANPRQPLDAISPERVVAVRLLVKLGTNLPDFCLRATLGEVTGDEWAMFTKVLHAAAQACDDAKGRGHADIEEP